ncbi:MAG TPA: M48 family metallopeptidase [Verrucomicrobiae bacterium]
MDNELYGKCACSHCGKHLEFPWAVVGQETPCPRCGQTTLLSAMAPPPSPAQNHSVASLLSSITETIPRTPVAWPYLLGLFLVALVMVLLPLVYLGIVAGTGWLMWYYAEHARGLLTLTSGGSPARIGRYILYVTPLLVGVLQLFFMVKPWFARRPRCAQPLALNPGAEPVLFAFIARICETVGAPMPTRIDLDCRLNASAGFRRGTSSLWGHDLVLTIGLPLVANLDMQQFAGVLAHEFGHFTQGTAMRLHFLIDRINRWFSRVVYERDAWDLRLEAWLEAAESGWFLVIGKALSLAVGSSRWLLKILMLIGHACGSFLLRQMEHDADKYAQKVAGSEAMVNATLHIGVLGAVARRSYELMRTSWNRQRQLPDQYPAFLARLAAALPANERHRLETALAQTPTSLWATHPSPAERMARARAAQAAGLFQLRQPATELFTHFEAVSRQITLLHYTETLGLPCLPSCLIPAAEATR